MLSGEQLLDAMSGLREEDVLLTARAMGYLPRQQKKRKNIWRPLLIAAVLGALLTATAVAATLLGRAERIAPMPPSPSGEERQAEIPNGFRGTPTYEGSMEWWTYMAGWEDAHGTVPESYDRSFVRDDLDRYLVCGLYEAYDPKQARKLYDIAEKYGLDLYREQVYVYDLEEFYRLTGVRPFMNLQNLNCQSGYVLEDGSFDVMFGGKRDLQYLSFGLRRYSSGSIFPFGGAAPARDYRETEYVTARGDRVFIDVFSDYVAEITYLDPTGETYIALQPNRSWREHGDMETICRQAADMVNFQALCHVDLTAIREILDQPTGAEENPDAVKLLQKFQQSPAIQGAREFQKFYQENFYGLYYTGTYGLAGYEDIDGELTRISEKYGLTYAREKEQLRKDRLKATAFDNGAGQIGLRYGGRTLHYIPKNALYTMQPGLLDAAAYRRIWNYQAQDGTALVLISQGPDTEAGSYALCETEKAYLLAELWGNSPRSLEQSAEKIEWAKIISTGGIKQ